MPDNKNQNQKGFVREQQGNRGSQQGGREEQGNRGSQGGKSSTRIENEDVRQVGNDNDLDRDLEDRDEDVITQRNPRMNERGEQGHGQMDRGGQGGIDRDRNR